MEAGCRDANMKEHVSMCRAELIPNQSEVSAAAGHAASEGVFMGSPRFARDLGV